MSAGGLKRRLLIVDSEVSDFARHKNHSVVSCAAETAVTVLARRPALAKRIGVMVVGSARTAKSEGLGNGLAQLIGERIGLADTPGVDVHAFCASANAAVHQAALSIEAGHVDVALVIGVEHMMAEASGPLIPEAAAREARHGFSPPVFYALCANRYLYETGAPVEALAQVAVNNRRRGVANARARYREAVTLEQVLDSRMIAEPLTLLQCCPPADGAGALLLAAADVVGKARPVSVEILGLGSASGNPSRGLLTSFREDFVSARAAYEAAGVGPDEIEVAEIHDAFTISQVIHLEDLELRPRGQGWRHALEKAPQPLVNPSGGLLSRGHPLGATGIAQFDAIRRHLTDARPGKRRRFGLVQEAGGLRPLGQIVSETAVLGRAGT